MNDEMNNVNNCRIVVRDIISKSILKVNCDEILNCIYEEIDTYKFGSWLEFNLNTFKSKTNQASYFKKAFINELNKGTFTLAKIYHLPNCQPLINELRDAKVIVLADDTAYLLVLWETLLNKYRVPKEVAKSLNGQIVSFIKDSENNTFAEYKRLVQECKTLKTYNIDWNEIDQRTLEYIAEWNNELERGESIYD